MDDLVLLKKSNQLANQRDRRFSVNQHKTHRIEMGPITYSLVLGSAIVFVGMLKTYLNKPDMVKSMASKVQRWNKYVHLRMALNTNRALFRVVERTYEEDSVSVKFIPFSRRIKAMVIRRQRRVRRINRTRKNRVI